MRVDQRDLQQGFTLVELMVAIAIMAVLTTLTAQTIQTGLFNKKKIQDGIARESQVRDALRVIERDINRAFHHRDFFTDMMNQIREEQWKKGQPGAGVPPAGVPGAVGAGAPPPPTQPIGAPPEKLTPPKKLTQFLGEADNIHFTTRSHTRTMRDARESDQSEVGYFLKSCRSRSDASLTSNCLWRRTSPILDDNVSDGGAEVVLLENVQEFRLRYFGPERDEWIPTWKSNENGDAVSKDRFPYAVEVTLTVLNNNLKADKKVTMSVVAAVRFPNNKAKEEPNAISGENVAPTGQ